MASKKKLKSRIRDLEHGMNMLLDSFMTAPPPNECTCIRSWSGILPPLTCPTHRSGGSLTATSGSYGTVYLFPSVTRPDDDPPQKTRHLHPVS